MIIDNLEFSAFSSVWFWLLMVAQWGVILLRPMGIPVDLFRDGQAADFDTMIALQVRRHTSDWPIWAIAAMWCGVTTLIMVAGLYQLEIAFAGLFLVLPWLWTQFMARRAARHLDATGCENPGKVLGRLNFWNQILGLIVFFLASFVGIFFVTPFIG